MTAFNVFLDANRLKKSELASILGVSKAYITQLSNGSCTISKEKLSVLMDAGYDCSALTDGGQLTITQTNNNGDNIAGHHITVSNQNKDLEALSRKIKELEDSLRDKDAQINRLISIIDKLSSPKEQ